MTEPDLGGAFDCQELLRLVNEYIDDEIDPELCKRLEAHMGENADCKLLVETLRETIRLYRDQREAAEPPAGLHDRLCDGLRARWEQRQGG